MAAYTNAVAQCVDYLRGLAHDADSLPDGKFPPVASLCRALNTSASTLSKAVRILEHEGVLTVIARKGIYAAAYLAAAGNAPPEEMRLPKWQQLKSRMEREICDGTYSPEQQLPSLKELQVRYGVCFQTAKKSVTALAADLNLQLYKKTYRIPLHRSARRLALVVLVPDVKDSVDRLATLHSPRGEEFLRHFERGCAERNLRLEIIKCAPSTSRAPGSALAALNQLARAQTAAGYVLWAGGMGEAEWVVSHVNKTGKPLAVVDEEGELSAAIRLSRKLRIFPVGAGRLGPRRISQYLLRLGHCHIAYIGDGDFSWSRIRYEAMLECMKTASPGNSVFYQPLASATGKSDFGRQVHTSKWTMDVLEGIQRLRKLLPDSTGRQAAKLARALDSLQATSGYRQYLESKLKEIFLQRNITAWVTANDIMALHAVRFLHRQKCAVPGRISIVGFDDSIVAFANGITSYNFNVAGIVSAIMNYCINPPGTLHSAQHENVIEVEGVLIERASSGRAR